MKPRFTTSARPAHRFSCNLMLLALTLCCMFPGCALQQWKANGFKLGPNYCRPSAPIAGDWLDSPDQRVNLSLPEYADWWSVFEDPTLNQLIDTARSQNLSLQEAGWRIQQARDARRVVVGNLFPQIQQASGGYQRALASQATAIPSPVRAFDTWNINTGLAWELDVWGRYRRAINAADATVGVAEGDYDAILLCLIADVAETYTLHRIFEQRLAFVERNIEIQEGTLKLSETRADEGKTGYVSVNLSRSNLESARALKPLLETGLRQTNNALCLLLGMPTTDLTPMLGAGGIPIAPHDVAVGIPADLLRRRPDIRAAERNVAVKSEQIGIAITDLYPSFSINGNIGWEAEDLGDLFTSPANTGVISPGFNWNILNYGRLQARVDLRRAEHQEAVTQYRNIVLNANREAADALVEFLKNQERRDHIAKSVDNTAEALRLVMISFEEGDISFIPVFILQGQLVLEQDQLAVAEGDVVRSLIRLHKALGGGWQVRCPNAYIRGIQGFPAGVPFAEEIEVPMQAEEGEQKDSEKEGRNKEDADDETREAMSPELKALEERIEAELSEDPSER